MEYQHNIEKEIIRLTEYLLATSNLEAKDNFLEVGGDSLTATLLAGAIERELGLKCSGAQILGTADFLSLANELALTKNERPLPRLIAQNHVVSPASPQQRRLYAEYGKDPLATNYNQPLLVHLPEKLDLTRLKASWSALLDRHTILRSVVRYSDDQIMQYVLPAEVPDIAELDSDQSIEQIMAKFVAPFDLSTYPLWRIGICRTKDNSQYLLFDIHHIITDGLSLQKLFAEWSVLYQGQTLSPQEIQYADYSAWVTGKDGASILAAQHSFWADTLNPLPARTELPADYQRTSTRGTAGDQIVFEVDASQTSALRVLAKQYGVTLFNVLLGIYSIWFYEATGSDDFIVGTPAAGRSVAGSEDCQGMFVNTVCLRFRINPNDTISAHIKSSASNAIRAFEHQDYPFDDLVKEFELKRDFTRNPIFDTMVALQSASFNEKRFLGEPVLWHPAATGGTLFDLNLQIEEHPTHLQMTWMYSTDLFAPATVNSFRDGLLGVIDRLINADVPINRTNLSANSNPAPQPSISFNF